jgi:hypothetical protein
LKIRNELYHCILNFTPWYEKLFPFREEVYLFLFEHASTSENSIRDAGCGPGHHFTGNVVAHLSPARFSAFLQELVPYWQE